MMTGELKTKIENIWDIWNMQKKQMPAKRGQRIRMNVSGF